MVLFSQFLTPASEVLLSWINYPKPIPHLWFPRLNKILCQSQILSHQYTLLQVSMMSLNVHSSRMTTIWWPLPGWQWTLRYHELYKYEKMLVRNITSNILLYPFLYSAKGKNTCCYGAYILIRAYIQVFKTLIFHLVFPLTLVFLAIHS